MAIYMTARFKIRPESREKVAAAIREFIAYLRTEEPATRLYVSMAERDDSTSFLHAFIFEDEVARTTHRNSAAVQRFTSTLYPELIGTVEFREYSLVASTAE